MRNPRAFSLVEVVVAAGIVGVMLVAALTALASSAGIQGRLARLRQGSLFARSLMAEIIDQPYEDESGGGFGPEAGEAGSTRHHFDDVDDYAGWTESPLQAQDGSVLTNTEGWRRTVAVEYVNPMSLGVAVPIDSGVKRITVRVYYRDAEMASLVSLRTRGLDEMSQ